MLGNERYEKRANTNNDMNGSESNESKRLNEKHEYQNLRFVDK